jgi:hypothetical protein
MESSSESVNRKFYETKNNVISKTVYHFSCLHSSKNKTWTLKAQIHDVNSLLTVTFHFLDILNYNTFSVDPPTVSDTKCAVLIVNQLVQPTCSMLNLFPAAGEATDR